MLFLLGVKRAFLETDEFGSSTRLDNFESILIGVNTLSFLAENFGVVEVAGRLAVGVMGAHKSEEQKAAEQTRTRP